MPGNSASVVSASPPRQADPDGAPRCNPRAAPDERRPHPRFLRGRSHYQPSTHENDPASIADDESMTPGSRRIRLDRIPVIGCRDHVRRHSASARSRQAATSGCPPPPPYAHLAQRRHRLPCVRVQIALAERLRLSCTSAPRALGGQVKAGPEVLERLPVIHPERDHSAEHRRERMPGTPSQSAHVPYSRVSSTSVSPTSNTTAPITQASYGQL